MGIKDRIAQLGLHLPEPPRPVGKYVPYKIINLGSMPGPADWGEKLPIVNAMLYISGMIPLQKDDETGAWDLYIQGKLGDEVSIEDGVTCAQLCTLNALGWANRALDGNIDNIIEVVQVRGLVASTPDFYDHAQIINGCSNMLVNIFGDDGMHTRVVAGAVSLPMDAPVEIDYVFSLR